jgi:hypothetical protein
MHVAKTEQDIGLYAGILGKKASTCWFNEMQQTPINILQIVFVLSEKKHSPRLIMLRYMFYVQGHHTWQVDFLAPYSGVWWQIVSGENL